MKTFLITSVMLLVGSLVIVIGVFWYLSTSGATQPSDKTTRATSSASVEKSSNEESSSNTDALELTSEQAARLEAVGINPDAVTVNQEKVDCAKGVLGEDRAAEIVAGDEPTLLEMGKLLKCI